MAVKDTASALRVIKGKRELSARAAGAGAGAGGGESEAELSRRHKEVLRMLKKLKEDEKVTLNFREEPAPSP